MARRRPGRPRKDGERGLSGRLRRDPSHDHGAELAVEQRAAAIRGAAPRLAGLRAELAQAKFRGASGEIARLEAEIVALNRANLAASDTRAATPLGLMLIGGLIDQAQYDAGVAFELKHRFVKGTSGGYSLDTHSCLASLLAASVPALDGIEDQDRRTQLVRAEALLRECYARMSDSALIEDLVLYHRAPAFLAGDAGTRSFHQLRAIQQSLDALALLFRIPRRRPAE